MQEIEIYLSSDLVKPIDTISTNTTIMVGDELRFGSTTYTVTKRIIYSNGLKIVVIR